MSKTYYVKVRCTVDKLVTCQDCTKEQARTEPWEHAIDEYETDQVDWEVRDVREDKS